MDLLILRTALRHYLHSGLDWLRRHWPGAVAVVAAVAISVALAAGPHLATLLVCGFIVQACVNAGVAWLWGRGKNARIADLEDRHRGQLARHLASLGHVRALGDEVDRLNAENASLKADLIAATEEKTALHRRQDELITGTREEAP